MAASVPALSPTVHSNTMLLGAFSWSCGAPGCDRLLGVDDGGQRLPVDVDRLERVERLGLGVSATTAATPSPVHLTLSVASVRGVLTLFWMPALPPAGQAIGSGLYGMSAPTKTATTPGIAFAAVVSIERMLACAYGLRRMAMWVIDGELDVVEVVAVAGDEARVLDPLDRCAEDVGGHRRLLLGLRGVGAPAPVAHRVAAASRIAATMFW